MNNSLADSSGDVISVAIDPQDATFSLVYNESLGTVEIESAADGYYAVLTDVDTLEGNYTTQYIYDEVGTELYSVAIGTVNSTIKVTEDEDLRPNVFFGYQTAIDFRDYTGDAIIDLRGDMAESIIDETIVIIDDDITTLYAGAGDTALKGDLDDETLFAGKGNTWLYGDGGKNMLVGYEGADKEGQTVFYVLGNEDGAAHTISGFNYVTDDNFTDTKKVTADALEFDLDDNNISRIDISGSDLVIEITDKAGNDTESALLKNAINSDGTGKDFIVSDNVAQVADNHLVFDQFADYYYATGKNATVEVSGRIEDDVVLWLDEDETGKVFEGDIAVIDATGSDATAQLAGNENDNVIFAGTGETSLWGGEGGNDVLVGNAGGRDTFYYSSGIAIFGGSNVVVSAAASATDVLAADVKQITFGESSTFQIEGESSAVTFVSFEIDSSINVGAVSYVGEQESVTGDFTGVSSVNGKSFDVANDNELAVVGNENSDGISVIGLVSDGAIINDVGGASQVITDEEGEFNFAGHTDAFSVVGDDSVTFNMSTSAPAIVKSITNFATTGESFAMVIGNLDGISINNKGAIDVEGDADDVLVYAKETYEGEDFYGLGVSGANVTINSAASANIIQTADGVYTFAMDKDAASTTYTVATAGDSAVLFEVEGNDVVGIYDMDKESSVTGDFSNGVFVEGISTSGVLEDGSVQILNDTVVTVVYDAFEVRNLSNGASITSFTDFKDAYTDAANDSLKVTDASNNQFIVEGDDDGVHYLLDGKGNIIGVDDLDEDATLKGSLGALSSVNGKDFDVKETILNYGGLSSGDGQFAIVGGSNGIGAIVDLGGRVTVNNGGGASKLVTDDNIFIRNKVGDSFVVTGIKENPAAYIEDITPSTVPAELIEQIAPYVTTKSDGVEFVTDGKDNVTAINGLSGNELVATFGQSLTGGEFPINDQELHIEGDVNLVAAVGTDDFDGISALVIGGASSVQLVKAAGASAVLALDVDEITFGESSTFTIESSKNVPGVGFDISGVDVKNVALLDDNESVTGNFNDIDSVNEKKFNVVDDEIMVVGSENVDAVSKIAKVSDGAIIANVAGASQGVFFLWGHCVFFYVHL